MSMTPQPQKEPATTNRPHLQQYCPHCGANSTTTTFKVQASFEEVEIVSCYNCGKDHIKDVTSKLIIALRSLHSIAPEAQSMKVLEKALAEIEFIVNEYRQDIDYYGDITCADEVIKKINELRQTTPALDSVEKQVQKVITELERLAVICNETARDRTVDTWKSSMGMGLAYTRAISLLKNGVPKS